MLCAFIGAGIGNYIRCKMTKHHLTLFLGIISSVSAACLSYTVLLRLLQLFFTVNVQHEAGYICSMLFIIPGFPFITSGIDLAKLDMRSGMERLMYSLIIITVATMTAWILACHFCHLNLHCGNGSYCVCSPALAAYSDSPFSLTAQLGWQPRQELSVLYPTHFDWN